MSWIRKKWPQFQSEFQKYTIDPAFVANDIEHEWSEKKERITDAENGRTCMSLDWIFEKIKTNRNLPIPRCSMYGLDRIGKNQVLKDPRDLEMRMRELVNRRIVFAIEYCRGAQLHPQKNFILNRTFRDKLTYLNTPAESENFAPGCDFHVAVIVGQSFRNEKCQLRIRDSWGQSLGDDFGHVWVDSDSLSRNVLRVVTMD
jgi:hypothetical protein